MSSIIIILQCQIPLVSSHSFIIYFSLLVPNFQSFPQCHFLCSTVGFSCILFWSMVTDLSILLNSTFKQSLTYPWCFPDDHPHQASELYFTSPQHWIPFFLLIHFLTQFTDSPVHFCDCGGVGEEGGRKYCMREK